MIIETRDQRIQDLLRSSYLLIPRFQRPYSWTSDIIEEFWDDLFSENTGDYFIGTFVVYKDKDSLAIVDGQQRLSTCVILLCCIREMLKKTGLTDLSQGLHELIEKKDINNSIRFTLETESSYPYFQHKIMSNKLTDSGKIDIGPEEQLIAQTQKIFDDKLTELVSSIRNNPTVKGAKTTDNIKNQLLKVRDKVLNLRFIKIELGTDDDAYVIFETLNTRGKDLSASDLVKNFITRKVIAKNNRNDPTKTKWQNIVDTIDGSGQNLNTSTFLHHYWLSKHDYVTIKKLFKEIKNSFTTAKQVEDFLDEIYRDSSTYRSIFDISFHDWKIEESELKKSLIALEVFKVKQQIPMVLSVLRSYSLREYSLKNVLDIVRAIESFHFIFTAVTSQRSSGGISQMYASSARNFASARTEEQRRKVCRELKKKLKEKIPSYKEFEANFSEIKFTKNISKQKDLVKYILYKYNQHLSKSYSDDIDILTIEHLMSESTKKEIVGQIGNLILVNKQTNEKLDNKPFDKKKLVLESSGITLDETIKNTSVWTEQNIESRTSIISKTAYQHIWKIN